jgi:hypothetical protein
MERKYLVVIAVLGFIAITSQLFAQETMGVVKTKTKSNQSNDRNADQPKVSCVGKITCGDGTCVINFYHEVVSPRDAASGLPTGKRQHKPFVITKELDKSSPMLARESPTKQSTGKVSMVDFHFRGKSKTLQVSNNQFTLPEDCDDGDCEIVASWSWGESNSGSVKQYKATFNLAAQNGEFSESKSNKTGHITLIKQ